MDKKILGRIYSRLIHKYFLNDMYLDLRVRAKKDTVDYIEANLKDAMLCQGRKPLIELCMKREKEAKLNGLILEFGVAGGTSTGKTTLTNALLAEIAKTADRVVIIEDTRELQCRAANLVSMRTKDGVASLSDLVRSSLRLRPDRIPIGEVRGSEALDLLKAWGTGHPGGIGTIHAGTAIGALLYASLAWMPPSPLPLTVT